MWVQPITDRTLLDVQQCTPKGVCNFTDLDRLEGNCAVLADLLEVAIITKVWQRTDFPTVSELQRIRDNVQMLREAYYTRQNTPPTPTDQLNHWQRWNALECVQADLYALWQENKQVMRMCGETYCGETIGVI